MTLGIHSLWSSLKTHDTHTCCQEFSRGAVTNCFNDLGLSWLGFEHQIFRMRGKCSNHLCHCRGFPIENNRPMGHIAHLKNQFKSMNTFELSYDYKYNKIDPVILKIFKFRECNFPISLLSPIVKRCGLSLFLFTQGCFLPSL